MTKIVFMGTPDFARHILQKILEVPGFEIVGVLAQPDKPFGRHAVLLPPPVAQLAREKGLPLLQPTKIREPEVIAKLKSLDADYFLVAAYGKILPQDVLDIPKKNCLNVHASLLPKYRGAAPIQHAILNGDDETGVDIMQMKLELDAGPVFLEEKCTIEDSDDTESLTHKLAELGAHAAIEAIQSLEAGHLEAVEQNHELATYAPKITKDMAAMEWNRPAKNLFNQIRALRPWPACETILNGARLRIFSARLTKDRSNSAPGTISNLHKEGWTVATADFNLIVQDVQLEGKKRMPAFDLANGLRLESGVQFGK